MEAFGKGEPPPDLCAHCNGIFEDGEGRMTVSSDPVKILHVHMHCEERYWKKHGGNKNS